MARNVSDEDLAMASQTLAHEEHAAGTFWGGIKSHHVTQNCDALLGAIEGVPPFVILDFGCGPGRDQSVTSFANVS